MSKKKFFTLLLALVTALTMSLAGTALAVDQWNGTSRDIVTVPASGVLEIATGAQLAGFADAVNAGTDFANCTVILSDDINLNNHDWTPIGRFFSYWGANRAFRGVFDGAGHNITGLNVVNNSGNKLARGETAALFGYIDFPAVTAAKSAAKAVSVTPAAKAQADAAVLGLTGETYDRVVAERTDFYTAFGINPKAPATRSITPAYGAKGIVKNVKVYGSVTNTAGQGAAGIVCWNDGLIENCYFEGTIYCAPQNRAYAGGICSLLGDNDSATDTYVVNCVVSADVKAHGSSFSYAGGIAGYCYEMNSGYVVNCSVQPGSKMDAYMDAGGVVGGFANQVYNCVSAADSVTVDGHNPNESGYYMGGIVGAFGTTYNCYWLQSSSTSTMQPGVAVGDGSDVSGLRTTVEALPAGSVFFTPTVVNVNGTASVTHTYYPTGAAANPPALNNWSTTDSSVAAVSNGTVTGYSVGTATVSATASSGAWSTSTPSAVSVTPESFVTVSQ